MTGIKQKMQQAACVKQKIIEVVNKMNLCTLCKSRSIILLPPFVVPVSIADVVADVVDLLTLCYITTQT